MTMRVASNIAKPLLRVRMKFVGKFLSMVGPHGRKIPPYVGGRSEGLVTDRSSRLLKTGQPQAQMRTPSRM
ncbi:hypothetical protein V1478_003126 [Vespula squamosa]|uniref:Uncharacterized protein n=1 Tax=Vespula squamosa TaxID=30214 RepID=A0ABD2BRT1_VESSQ